MFKQRFYYSLLLLFPTFIACKGPQDEILNSSNDSVNQDYYSLETCETLIGPGVPDFYSKYFKCVTINMSETGNYINIMNVYVVFIRNHPNILVSYRAYSHPNHACDQIRIHL